MPDTKQESIEHVVNEDNCDTCLQASLQKEAFRNPLELLSTINTSRNFSTVTNAPLQLSRNTEMTHKEKRVKCHSGVRCTSLVAMETLRTTTIKTSKKYLLSQKRNNHFGCKKSTFRNTYIYIYISYT
jgi:hypothetical protein